MPEQELEKEQEEQEVQKEQENQEKENEQEQEEEKTSSTDPLTEIKGLANLVAGSLRQISTRLDAIEGRANNPAKEPEKDPDAAEFHSNPVPLTRKIVEEVVARVNKPVIEMTAELRRDRELTSVVGEYIRVGGDAKLVEKYKDYLPQALKGQEINIGTIDASLAYLVGQTAMGRIKLPERETPKNDDNRNDNNMNSSRSTPTSKSSPSIMGRKKDKSPDEEATSQLTESQIAYARKAGLSPAEALALVNADSRVDSWPRKKAKKEGEEK